MDIGVYLTSGDVASDPQSVIAKLRRAGAKRANLFLEGPDGAARRPKLSRLLRWADALRVAGMEPWVWTFPTPENSMSAADFLSDVVEQIDPVGVWLDIERPPPAQREAGAKEWNSTVATQFAIQCAQICQNRHIGVTSYPAYSVWKRKVCLDNFAKYIRLGAPQFYTSAASAPLVTSGMSGWATAFPFIVPILACYIGDAARLDKDITTVVGKNKFKSFDVWSCASLSDSEAVILRKWSQK